MNKVYQASVLYIKIASQFAATNKVDLVELHRGLSPISDGLTQDSVKLPLIEVLNFWDKASELTADKDFGLHAGLNCHVTNYGVFAHVLMNCTNVYQALQLACHYGTLMNEALESTLSTENELIHYSSDFLYPHKAAPQLIEFHLASMVQMGKQIVSRKDCDKVHPVRVEFCHEPLTELEEYKRAFGCEVAFQQAENRLIAKHETLLTPSNAPNEWLYRHLLKEVDAIFQAEQNRTFHSGEVSDYLNAVKEWGHWPTLEETALALKTSTSTRKRKLKQESCSYQEVSDRVRYRRAKYLLRSQKYTVSEVAFAVGFSCAASFGRSFKRWSGKPPSDFKH